MNSIVMAMLQVSIFVGILAIGLGATVKQVTSLFGQPKLLIPALLALNVAMPIVAIGVALGFDLNPVIRLALVTFAVSPVVHLYVSKTKRAGGDEDFVLSLFVLSNAAAIILIPATVALLHRVLITSPQVSTVAIATLIGKTVLLPLVVGMVLRVIAPAFALRFGRPLEKLSLLFLLGSFIPLLVKVYPVMWSFMGDGTLAAIVGYELISMLVGHLAGGRVKANRIVLDMAAVSRHPATAIAVARMVKPDEPRVVAAIILLVIVSALITAIFGAIQKRQMKAQAVDGGTRG